MNGFIQFSLTRTVAAVLCVAALSMPVTGAYAQGNTTGSSGGGKVSDRGGASHGGSDRVDFSSNGGIGISKAVIPGGPLIPAPQPVARNLLRTADVCSKPERVKNDNRCQPREHRE